MRRTLLAFAAALCGLSAAAELSAREAFRRAEPEVRAATADLLADLARGETTREEVAEAVRIMASQTAEPAEEYLFLQGAFRLFVRAGAYGRAADVLRRLRKREFPAAALADLVGQALEPVPRGTDVGELESMRTAFREEAAQRRRQAAERRVAHALERTRLPAFRIAAGEALPDVLHRVRLGLRSRGEPGFRIFLRCPLAADGTEAFPALPGTEPTDVPPADVLARGVRAGAFEMRPRGDWLLFVCGGGEASTAEASVFFAGNGEDGARRLKRIPLGFVAFDGGETLDAAVERLLAAVADYGRPGERPDLDVVLRSPSGGRFPRMGTLRASDTTLYDALDLAARSVGYVFEVRGACIVLRPDPSAAGAAGTVP